MREIKSPFLTLSGWTKLSQNTFYIVHTLFDDFFIIRAAILTKKELQNIHRYICFFFDMFCQILADNLSIKLLAKFALYPELFTEQYLN